MALYWWYPSRANARLVHPSCRFSLSLELFLEELVSVPEELVLRSSSVFAFVLRKLSSPPRVRWKFCCHVSVPRCRLSLLLVLFLEGPFRVPAKQQPHTVPAFAFVSQKLPSLCVAEVLLHSETMLRVFLGLLLLYFLLMAFMLLPPLL